MLQFEQLDQSPFQRSYMDRFLKKIKSHSSFHPLPRNISQAKFIFTQESPASNFGGAVLLKQAIPSLHRDLRKTWGALCKENETWVCTAGLSVVEGMDTENVCKEFYASLYEKLCLFGQEMHVSYLYVILNPGEYLSTEAMGFWPYVAEIRPCNSYDGLFHGILSLAIPTPVISQWHENLKESILLAA